MNEDNRLIETFDEDGNVVNLELYDIVEVDGEEYALLINADAQEESEDAEIVLMHMRKEGEECIFEQIEDEEEFNRVEQYILSMDDEDYEEE